MIESAGRMIRLAVQSSRRLTRDTLAAYLAGRPDFTVVGQTAALSDLSALCLLRRPDVAVVDAGPLTVDLVAEVQDLRAAVATVDVVVVYTDLTPTALHAANRAGITRLVPSARGLDALLRALLHRSWSPGRMRADGTALTEREIEVISLLAAGNSVPEMARLLQISPRTVETHKRRLYAKLGVGTQSRAVSRAASLGLSRPPFDVDVRPVADGRDPRAADRSPTGSAHPDGLPDLTARESDILSSIADGDTVRQTARVLGIAAKTVENTQARLFRKLGARNRSGALTVAYRLGLIDPASAAHPTP